MATTIGNIVVDTDNLRIATRVAVRAQEKTGVRGVIQVMGERYRWSTLQQYEYHGGFTSKRGRSQAASSPSPRTQACTPEGGVSANRTDDNSSGGVTTPEVTWRASGHSSEGGAHE